MLAILTAEFSSLNYIEEIEPQIDLIIRGFLFAKDLIEKSDLW